MKAKEKDSQSEKAMLDAAQLLLGVGRAVRRREPRAPGRTLPFTLITGFLGGGKTTFVRRILETVSDTRIAVLVNDFGELNIDAALIKQQTDDTIELANGCVCCSLANGFADALADLTDQPDPPDHVLLEASGVAEPSGILHVALTTPGVRLNGVIAIVDATTFAQNLADEDVAPTLRAQLAAADLVLLNKTDLSGDNRRREANALIAGLSRGRIIETTHADVPNELVLGPPLSNPEPIAAGAHQPRNQHKNPFVSWKLQSDAPLDKRKLCALAGALPPSILRAKGFVSLAQDPERAYLLQVVGRRWSLDPNAPWEDASKRNEVVLIGKQDDAAQEEIARRFAACSAEAMVCEPPLDHAPETV